MSFANKVVLVIGASSGIGASAAILYTKEGADIVMVGRNTEKLTNVANECKKRGKAPLVIKADIKSDEEATKAVEETINKFGKLDILLNNAGMARYGSILDGNLIKSYDETLSTNLRALMLITQVAAPYLIKTKGNIINISSIAATCSPILPAFITYGVSKAGLNYFTKGAALELAPHGVRVNAISPGPVKTDFIENCGSQPFENAPNFKFTIPLERIAEPDEVADLILFLSSEKAKSITGSIYVTDNGCSLVS
ncbi:3-oxoacyl-[acyl-carrier-protein] reductase FabG-like [Epargyreus clarus]|uniref:3-oxoacyl-[acyl-carrier-protein] reductase FabG-like n=1 Tax=Epargyreus clarus TaxID=520877 RepID=UPI003C2FC3B6